MKRMIILYTLLVLLVSCDETNSPSSDYLIEKTVNTSTEEQTIESGSDFKMIFPANSVKGNLEIKVKKESSYPTFSFSSTQLGKNVYKVKFSGESSFQSPAKIIINYDISKVPSGKTASETVKAYICSNGIWKLSSYTLNESQKQLIISISSFDNPKIDKDYPVLQDNEGDIIIGDGYTTTDTGISDNPLARYNFFSFHLISNIVFDDGDNDDDDQWEYEYTSNSPAIKWNKNEFSFKREVIEPKNWITEYETMPDSTIEIGYGTVAADGKKIIKFTYEYYFVSRTYYGPSRVPDLKIILKTFTLENLDIALPDLKLYPNSYPYEEITGSEISKCVKKLNCIYYYNNWDPIDKEADITEKKSIAFNWNGSYSRLGVYFLKLDNLK